MLRFCVFIWVLTLFFQHVDKKQLCACYTCEAEMPTSCQCSRNRSSLTRTYTLTCTQIDELLILFHGLCRWRKWMPMQRDQNHTVRETSVIPAVEQEWERKSRSTGFVTPLTLQLFTACPWPLRPARYLFLDPFFVEMSVLSAHQTEAAFPFPVSVENTIKEKNQCILKQWKSQ